ncbi:MAG: DUF2142 domain-containing protein [Armatimonadetes bacterium]|nr:DUF2142 domain-containing protein [Armatimonadota bacterium]
MRLAELTPRALAVVYVVYAALAAAITIWKTPPFMGPDEPNHFKRANLTLFGEWVGHKVDVNGVLVAGGTCEPTVSQAAQLFAHIPSHVEAKVDSAMMAQAESVAWGTATDQEPFPNSAVYPPTLYLPQTLAVAAGKAAGASVIKTLAMARLANAVVCVAIGAVALGIAGRAAPYLFTFLLMPKPVFLTATVTQDGMIVALTALVAAVLGRCSQEGRGWSRAEAVVTSIALLLVAMAKAPYALFALGLFFAPVTKLKVKLTVVSLLLMAAFVWHGAMAVTVQTPLVRSDVVLDPSAQAAIVAHHPAIFVTAMARTLATQGKGLVIELVGSLGSMDTPMPGWFFPFALVVLAATAGWIAVFSAPPDWRRLVGYFGLASVIAFLIGVGLYLVWTPIGANTVEGLQGRYFLPILMLLPLAFAGKGTWEPDRRLQAAFHTIVVLAPVVSLFVLEQTLQLRYFG